MLMDSKGKVFGKISIVDILVVLLIIVAVFGAWFRFSDNNKEVVVNNQEFYYTISINNIRETNKDLLMQSMGTKFALDGKIHSTMGELVDLTVNNAIGYVTKNDGEIVSAEIPEKYDAVLTLKVVGNVNDHGYFTPENHEVCAGKEYNIKNIYCSLTGYVDKVWVEK